MEIIVKVGACVALAGVLLMAGGALAVTPAQKCQAAKLKITGKYAFCRLQADAKAVKTGQPADYTKCFGKFADKFTTAEFQAAGMCPTQNDLNGVEGQVLAETAAFKKLQARWVDNLDETVSDTQTGLMWEKKNEVGGLHYASDAYTWSSSGTAADGMAFTDFLGELNKGTSGDGATVSGCFAGHCDWRLPTIAELQAIVDLTAFGCGAGEPCINAAFGPTLSSLHWSSTTHSSSPSDAWDVSFFDGSSGPDTKTGTAVVRAVRGGP